MQGDPSLPEPWFHILHLDITFKALQMREAVFINFILMTKMAMWGHKHSPQN